MTDGGAPRAWEGTAPMGFALRFVESVVALAQTEKILLLAPLCDLIGVSTVCCPRKRLLRSVRHRHAAAASPIIRHPHNTTAVARSGGANLRVYTQNKGFVHKPELV